MATRGVFALGLQRRAFAAVVCVAWLLISDVVIGPAPVLSCTEATEGTDCARGEQCVCSSSGLNGDPHLELTGPDGQRLTWDFHGRGNQSYCMVTDKYITLNTHMFTLPPDVRVIKQEVLDGASNWTSSDSLITISQEGNATHIFMPELLTMTIKVEPERELITEPPIYCLNFEIKTLYTTPNVHGFLGQMHAPGAIAERLQVGTLEGLMHREYVEGSDDEYATSDLTATDCFFNRFAMDGDHLAQPHASSDTTSSIRNWKVNPGRRLLQVPDFESASKSDTNLQRRANLETQCECVSKSCSSSTTCKATQECCGAFCTSPLTLTLPACGFVAVYRQDSTALADLLGYVSASFDGDGLYTFTPAMSEALEIRFDPSYEYSAFAVNGPDPQYPYVGAISLLDGYIGLDSPRFLLLGGLIAPPPPSSTPRPAESGDNSFSDRTGLPNLLIEDAIWTLGGQCSALDPQWVNTDSSKPATNVLLIDTGRAITFRLVEDGDAHREFFGLDTNQAQSVSLRFFPAVGGCSSAPQRRGP
ncbi:hypothetical protein KFL_000040460 [Klebsormidium nitens]|uniref:Uncharacterized protein n=1 Tax=Klebsormidium nitens TaxID=105231 RepID=A0A1Y1HML9_KLENI|nr:hypothetical protein KFL_000040460 [Klebsormidium nitens]|eukprot:GAQ77846.1 hypothetical protein KFL_000040460 [Klebsormidium nitens]